MANSRKILLSGMIAADPCQGGATWAVLQYFLGLRRLGHDVFFIEPVPFASLRPRGTDLENSENASYFRRIIDEFGMRDRAALLLAGTRQTFGLSYQTITHLCAETIALFNISGMLTEGDWLARIPNRVYLDLDPAFNQLWQTQGIDMRFAGHTHFVTVGQALGRPGCHLPTCAVTWLPTLQPVVLEHWPVTPAPPDGALTTVANWRGYGSIDYNGELYGQKAHSLRQFIDVPLKTNRRFTLALAIHPDETRDLGQLSASGWNLVDPQEVAATPADYRRFIQQSWAEFGIAKSGYVVSRCGWFSDRSACYLASGRPVIAQETGFSRFIPSGQGLLPFTTHDDILAAIATLQDDYRRHSLAARRIAEDYFDSDKVLTRLLHLIGINS